jgi:hypothetical protein
MSLKLVKMNEIKKNKWFQQAITMKTIIPESYNSNGAVLRCKQHLYILMIENIVPIYRLEYSETPFGRKSRAGKIEKLQVQSVGEADCEYKAIYPRIIS